MKSLGRIVAVFRKELMQIRRDRVTLGMIVMLPFVQLLLFGYAINTDVRNIPAAVVDQSGSALGRILTQIVSATQVVDFVERFDDPAAAERAIVTGRVRAAFIIPPDLAQRLVRSPAVGHGLATPRATDEQLSRPVAQWIVDGSDTTIAASIKALRAMPLNELFDEASNQATPTFETVLFYNPEQRSAVNIVPGLVGIILTMTMIMFTSAAIVRENERGNMEMLINTPVRPIELMVGKIIPYIFIGLVQAAIILGLGHLIYGVPFADGLLALAVATLLFIGASLSLGLVLSTIAKNQLQAMQLTIFILLPSILLSGFMFPYEGMPRLAQHIAEALPATHFMRAIRAVVLRDATLAEIRPDTLWLGAFMLGGLVVASLRFRKRLG
jgi:ABC-2 type transport system permease protein